MSHDGPYLMCITGPMFAGKTSAISMHLSKMKATNARCLYINSSVDTRSQLEYSTHNDHVLLNVATIKAKVLKDIDVSQYDVIAIDEAQFFPDLLSTVLVWLETLNKYVIVAGLMVDAKREVFGQLLRLSSYADENITLHPFCNMCMTNKKRVPAIFTKLCTEDTTQVCIGGADKYISLCRKCYLL